MKPHSILTPQFKISPGYILSVLCTAFLFSSLPAWTDTGPSIPTQAKLSRGPGKIRIPLLRINEGAVEVRRVFRNLGELHGAARVVGIFSEPDSALLLNQSNSRISVAASGKFSIWIKIAGAKTPFTLTRVGPRGDVQKEEFQLEFPQWTAWIADAKKKHQNALAGANRFSLNPGLGITYQTYKATGAQPIQQLGLTVKVGAAYSWTPRKWTVGGNVFITALPLSRKDPYQDVMLRVLGANFRVGYLFAPGFLGLAPPWSLSLAAGGYYSTTLGAAENRGYENVGGPQIYPVLKRKLADGSAWTTYFKYSPILSDFRFVSLSSHELAAGLGYQPPTRVKSAGLGFTLDFAQLALDAATVQVQSQSVTLGVGVTF